MIRLIKGELTKLIHKKSFLIVTIIFILFCILTNFIYKEDYEEFEESVNINELEANLKDLDLKNSEDLDTYLNNKTEIKLEKLKIKYNGEYNYIINNYLSDIIYNLEEGEVNNNSTLKKQSEENLNLYLKNLENKDWNFFSNLELKDLREKLKNASGSTAISTYEALIDIVIYRINNNIDYNKNNYLNKALIELETYIPDYFTLKNKGVRTNDEEDYYQEIKAKIKTNKYILENKVDINNTKSLSHVLDNFSSDFGLFILIYIIMISGSIVSEEFNKGTIKYLLTKPFKRSTILASKLLTTVFLIPLIIIGMILIDFIIGGFILGFDTLNIPILIITESSTITRHVFCNLALSILGVLPSYLILNLICFMLSTITTSTSAAITITFLFYLIGNVISNIALVYNINIIKYFISLHWDFSYLVTKTPNPYNFSWTVSTIVNCIYILIIICITFVYFNKKDVKNI